MKQVLLTGFVLISAAATLGRAAAPQPAAGRLTIEQLIDIKHPSSPMWSPDGKSVAFVWDRAGVSKVYVAAVGGGAPRELPDAGTSLAGAVWATDGGSLLVPKDGDLWRVPLDGGAAAAVWKTPAVESNIALSPDGARAAFVRSDSAAGRSSAGALIVRSLVDGRETVLVPAS